MMKERLVRITDRNRLTIPKEAFEDLELTSGEYVLVRWYVDKKLIEIVPVDIRPKNNENLINAS